MIDRRISQHLKPQEKKLVFFFGFSSEDQLINLISESYRYFYKIHLKKADIKTITLDLKAQVGI